jgi:hypothetical protein
VWFQARWTGNLSVCADRRSHFWKSVLRPDFSALSCKLPTGASPTDVYTTLRILTALRGCIVEWIADEMRDPTGSLEELRTFDVLRVSLPPDPMQPKSK